MSAATPAEAPVEGEEAPAVRRTRALSRNVIAGFIGRGINMLAGLLTVPLTVRALGAEGYGLFQTITSVSTWVNLGSLGLGKGLLNGLVESRAAGDLDAMRRQVASYTVGIGAIMAAGGLLFAAVFAFVPWDRIFPSDAPHWQTQVPGTVALTVFFTATTLLASFVGIVFSAYQNERRASVLAMARAVTMVVALAVVALVGGGMIGVALAIGVAATLVNIAGIVWLFGFDSPELRFSLSDVSMPTLRKLVSRSLLFFGVDVAALLVFSLDRLIILHFAGATDVASYDVTARLFAVAYSLYQVVLMPLWPAFGDAMRRGDLEWTRRTLNRVTGVAVAGMFLLVVVMLLVGGPLVALWTGNTDLSVSPLLILGLGAFFIVRAFSDVHTILLFGSDKPGAVLASAVVHGLLAVSLGVAFGRQWGTNGVVAANALAFAVTAGWWVPYRARRGLSPPGVALAS